MRAAAYARYSTDQQTDNSIATQLDAITKYSQRNGHDIVAVFTDEARSGTNTDREGFQRLLDGAVRKNFECVIIYDITRGSRNVVDWFTFREQMRENNVKVFSVTEQLGDISDPNTFLMELIGVGIGQHQVLQSRQKSIAGRLQKAKEGVFLGGFAPLGYDIVKRQYVINEKEAEAVRLIFKLYSEGHSYDYILMFVKDLAIIGKRGRPIGKNSINSILNNDRYIGVYSWNRHNNRYMKKWSGGKETPELATEIENAIPPIIDKDTWHKVQERLKNNRRNASNTAKTFYLLSGKIFCTNCGGGFFGKTNTNTRGCKTKYYTCGNKSRTKNCDAYNYNAEILENAVVEALKEWLKNIDYDKIADELIMMSKARKSNVCNIAVDSINQDIVNIRYFISISENDEQRNTLIKQLAALEDKRIELTNKELKDIKTEIDKDKIINRLKKDASCLDETSIISLVKEYVLRVNVYQDDINIEIGINIKNDSHNAEVVTIIGSPGKI